MKKVLALVLSLVMLLSCAALAEETDAVSSASVADYYGAYALTGDDLMTALNSYSGTYILATVNEDGSPCAAFFIYACVKNEDKYYVQLGLAENQSRQNLIRTGEAVGVYAAAPGADFAYSISGARMTLKLVTDEEVLKVLNQTGSETVLFAEIVAVKPLG